MLTGKPQPVRALYASGVNILVTYPDTRRTMAALQSLDFVAVAAHQMTPTAEWADIVLPKTTTLEEEEVSSAVRPGGAVHARARPAAGRGAAGDRDRAPVARPLGPAQATGKRLLPWRSQRAFNEYLLGDSGITYRESRGRGIMRSVPRRPASRPFATPSGKVELSHALRSWPRSAARPRHRRTSAAAARARYPLTLVTGDREKGYHHSRFRDQSWALKVSPDPRLVMHPHTAGRMALRRRLGAA